MTCPDLGTWRAWLDGEAQLDNAGRHLDACGDCAATVERLRDDATWSGARIAVLAPPRERVAAAPVRVEAPVVARLRPARWRWVGSAAAAVLTLAVVSTPFGRTAAADFLAAFRSERFAVVAFDEASATSLAQAMEQLGTVSGAQDTLEPQPVADLAAAEQAAGFELVEPDPATLPAAAGQPTYMVTPPQELRVTFDAARTQTYLDNFAAEGIVPEGYDGSTLVVRTTAAALAHYGDDSDAFPTLLLGQTQPITADMDPAAPGGLSLEDLRAFLLQLPGLSDGVVQQLDAIEDWRQTLPIPVPLEAVAFQDTEVAGTPALIFSEPGLGSALLWQRDNRIIGLGGTLDEATLRAVAEGLR